jgi:hypothetical protein
VGIEKPTFKGGYPDSDSGDTPLNTLKGGHPKTYLQRQASEHIQRRVSLLRTSRNIPSKAGIRTHPFFAFPLKRDAMTERDLNGRYVVSKLLYDTATLASMTSALTLPQSPALPPSQLPPQPASTKQTPVYKLAFTAANVACVASAYTFNDN